MNRNLFKRLSVVVPSVAAVASQAAGPDLSTLTAAVDFTTTSAAILTVSAGAIVLYLGWKAAKLVIHAVKGA